MTDDRIEGFVAGTVSMTVTTTGGAITLALKSRLVGEVECVMAPAQSQRLRRLLSAAEKRARP